MQLLSAGLTPAGLLRSAFKPSRGPGRDAHGSESMYLG